MSTALNPKHQHNFKIEGYQDLGWQEQGRAHPKAKACKALGHKMRFVDNSLYLRRGTDDIYICDECKIYHHIDSSD